MSAFHYGPGQGANALCQVRERARNLDETGHYKHYESLGVVDPPACLIVDLALPAFRQAPTAPETF